MLYPLVLTLHLFAAILFVGSVFFEVFVLTGVAPRMGAVAMEEVEKAVFARAKRLMPFVVVTLFATGITLATLHWGMVDLAAPDAFTVMLLVKIAAAFSVLGHFIFALLADRRGGMSAKVNRLFHLSLVAHMVVIVAFAKLMFHL